MRRDAVIAAGLAVVSVAELLAGKSEHRPAQIAIALAVCGVVAFRRRHPLAVSILVGAAFAGLALLDLEPEATGEVIAFLLAVFTAAAELPLRRAAFALGVLGVALLLQDLLIGPEDDFLWILGVFLLPPFMVGRLYRDRRERVHELERVNAELAAERERSEALAVQAERARIAREMHDVLSHSMSLMTVQAGAGERLAERDPARAADAFRAIREAGSDALADLRRMLGLLHADTDHAPQPGLRELAEAVERVRATGLDATLSLEAEGLPPGIELTVHRIVQEALTNTLKHADASRVDVRVARMDGAVHVSVEDDGAGTDHGGGSRRGLTGMRERAAVYGGDVEAGPRPGGGFAVRARIPFSPWSGRRR